MPISCFSRAATPNAVKPQHLDLASVPSPRALRHTLARQDLKSFCDRTLRGLFMRLVNSPRFTTLFDRQEQEQRQRLQPNDQLRRLVQTRGQESDEQQLLDGFLDAILLSQVSLSPNRPNKSKPSGPIEFDRVADLLEYVKLTQGVQEQTTVCSHLFLDKGIAFTCATCRLADESYVLCYDCFRSGNHLNHQVRQIPVEPGCTCDCGDPESYRSEGCCVRHRYDVQTGPSGSDCKNDSLVRQSQEELPSELLSVASILFHELVEFMVLISSWVVNSFDLEKVKQSFSHAHARRPRQHFFRDNSSHGAFVVRLYDDDIHTTREFIDMLKKNCVQHPNAITGIVDDKQCAVVYTTNEISSAMSLFKRIRNAGFRVSIVSDLQLRHEKALIHVLRWLRFICDRSATLRRMLSEELLQVREDCVSWEDLYQPRCPLETLFLADSAFHRDITDELYRFYARFQVNPDYAVPFSMVFVRALPRLMTSTLEANHFGTRCNSLFLQCINVFRKESICLLLSSVIPVVQTLVGFLEGAFELSSAHCPEEIPTRHISRIFAPNHRVVDPNCSFIQFRRYYRTTHLLTLVLSFSDIARNHLLMEPPILSKWLDCLRYLQGMNLHLRIRETEPHVEHEKRTYIFAINLHVLVTKASMMVVRGLNKHYDLVEDEESGSKIEHCISSFTTQFWRSLRRFLNDVLMEFYIPANVHYFCKSPMPIVRYDVSSQPVSFHYALHQQFGLFLLELVYGQSDRYNDETDWRVFFEHTTSASGDMNSNELIWCLMEFPLRTLLFAAQVQGGLWARNSDALKKELRHYLISHKSTLGFRDVDLVLIQFCALVLGREIFLAAFFDRCGFLPWLLETNLEQSSTLPSDKMIPLVEESLLVLIWLVTELPMSLEELTEKDAWFRRHIVHRLAKEALTFQQLLSCVDYWSYLVFGPITPVRKPKDAVKAPDVVSIVRLERILAQVARIESKATLDSNSTTIDPETGRLDECVDGLAPTKYELTKTAFATEYDPGYCRLERCDSEIAQARRNDVLLRTWKEGDAPIPLVAHLPRAHGSFANFRLVLLEKSFLGILRVLLEDNTLELPVKSSVLVIMRVLHLLNLVVLVLKEEKCFINHQQRLQVLNLLRSGRESFEQESSEPSRKRLRRDYSGKVPVYDSVLNQASGVHGQSIVDLLVTTVKCQSANDSVGLKWSISAINWILKELATMDAIIDGFVRDSLWINQAGLSETKKLERKKFHQQRALETMLARQKAFAEVHESGLTTEDEEEEKGEEAKTPSPPTPQCIICSEVDESQAIMFIGHIQASQLSAHALFGRPCANIESDFARPQLHIRLCGHTVHLTCWQKHIDAVNERQDAARAEELPFECATFSSQLGEFLCPLCQTLSSTVVPYVNPRSVASVEERNSVAQEMNRVIQFANDASSIAQWLAHDIADRLTKWVFPAEIPAESLREGMDELGRSCQEAVLRFATDAPELSAQISSMKGAYQGHLFWSSIASTLNHAQLSGMSMAIFANECPTGRPAHKNTTVRSFRLNDILNPHAPSLRTRLALDQPPEFERTLRNSFSSKDEAHMSCILRVLRLVPLLYDSTESFHTAVCAPLAENLQLQLSKSTWIHAYNNDSPLVLGLPIFSQDLMHLLVVLCGLLERKADFLMTVRSFCVLHMAQVLIRCSFLEAEAHNDDGGSTVDDEVTKRSLETLMQVLHESSGFTQLRTTSAPSGVQLKLLFEASSLAFLRQVSLLCRAIFCDDHPQFASSLKLSTNFEEMRELLGVPKVQDIIQDTMLMSYLRQAAHQLQTNPCGFLHTSIHKQWVTDQMFGESLTPTTILTNNAAWIPPLPIREETQAAPGCSVVPGFYFANVRFIRLPELLIDLVHQYKSTRCPSTGGACLEPALCLICGECLCAASDCCSQKEIGACTLHARKCGDGVGAFLVLWNDKPRIRSAHDPPDCKIVLITGPRNGFYPNPYVDQFGGDEDTTLLMRLDPKRLLPLLKSLTCHRVVFEVSTQRALGSIFTRSNYY